ncbi:MAG: response regulator transcription factor [Treponema sp.]|nr:response regulator transcription factor [Treponema sp.]
MNKLNLLLVDDQRMFAESLKIYLTNYAEEVDIIGICSNGKEACDFVDNDEPDIILMDVHMPEMDGVEAVAKIKAKHPSVKIIMLSTYDEDESVRSALINGASGYLLKDISPTELIVSIRALNSGMIQISPSIAKNLIQSTYVEKKHVESDKEMDDKFPWFDTLTEREREIFALLATGKDNQQISEELCISPQTVRNRVSTIYSKLEVKDRFEIIQLANKLH